MASAESTGENERPQSPIFWFALLETAIAEGDLEEAGRAIRELRMLGIDVVYRCRPRFESEEAHA
jgi:hypothetical protein